ncbi:MAG: endopeptidase La [Candidatus Scalindua sp. AMX11]|nr:MAG: endopeptidase La [Candidatus Scalindua sp.]NOG84428.1 endopeptidase La [Planctomycetota bacterium]RZV72457.1 MAG: endopeptidase La [Candidatus Scalindua sp. SCAELEC01]TDE64612.1 MAG: endopeptidase La [Candidatus Scalindua sp. AMX11]GJQ59709.1 MAG: Lon protease [Candidatus Scalindua sp.]
MKKNPAKPKEVLLPEKTKAPDSFNPESLEVPEEIPVLSLKDVVVFPQMVTALGVSTDQELKLLDTVLAANRFVVLVAQKDSDKENLETSDLYELGTASVVLQMLRMPDNSAKMLVQGIARVHIEAFTETDPFFKAKVKVARDEIDEVDVEIEALATNAKNQFTNMVTISPHLAEELKIVVVNIEPPGRLADLISSHLNISVPEKQEILELINVKERLKKVNAFINNELQVLELASKIQSQVKNEMEKGQREYYLRQQLKAVQDELGEGDEHDVELNELREKIKQAKLPKEAQDEADRELSRLSKMHPSSAEYTVARTYLDWLTTLPWTVSTEDNLNIPSAKKILDEDHYNLKKVKERILEYLAVRKLKNDMKGPILCFVGPPGTGKTSVGKSIARAMGRKFVRMSLGGIRDEAEIRGHRRTYVGALPGRIIQGLRKASSNNPVYMLDEVDKLVSDFHGDPSSALLEVLDPEQNNSFSDHYLDVPFDLSKVMFITTANILDTIPSALKDRMEVLDLPGYTTEEKLGIAKQYLVPKQFDAHGLKTKNLKLTDDAIKVIISDYTREAGVRNLERQIGTVCRKVAKEVASGNTEFIEVNADKMSEFLGPVKFFLEVAERTLEPGVATGLAWTQSGGEILFIESTRMTGSGKLTLTGQLGDVMKESAEAAMSYVRSNAQPLGISVGNFSEYDYHIHVPSGAIPKDGPSAGVTMAISLISLFKSTPIKPYIAMTGEITLKGRILPVGGIKEKVLAAKRAGIKTIILPKRNENDLTEVPDKAKEKLSFLFVEKVDDLLTTVFGTKNIKKEPSSNK